VLTQTAMSISAGSAHATAIKARFLESIVAATVGAA
jgi:hypothetical protein